MNPHITLGIETSCDDTAAAVVQGGKLLSSKVSTQLDHESYGGVVPEIASRAHQLHIIPVVAAALQEAGLQKSDVQSISVTTGPGLIGSLLVGLSFAKSLSLAWQVPLFGVNHLEGHIASLFLSEHPPPFPFLCLIVSGGHTQLMRVGEGFRYTLLGRTRDDAAGEAFDKVGKLLEVDYPGGPAIDRLAMQGDAAFVSFPRTRLEGYDYSFSGIKTSMLYHLGAVPDAERAAYLERHRADLCASFQRAMVDMLVAPVEKAMRDTGVRAIGVVGGVSANSELRRRLTHITALQGGTLHVPRLEHCTDNAAMIALAGYFRSRTDSPDPLTLIANPSLAID